MWLNNMIESMWDWVLSFWSEGLSQVEAILTTSPAAFADGKPWHVVQTVFAALQGTGYALLLCSFYIGLTRTSLTLADLRRPIVAVSIFFRLIIVKALIDVGMGLLELLLSVGQQIVALVFGSGYALGSAGVTLPDEIRAAIGSAVFLEKALLFWVSLLAVVVIIVATFTVLFMVYGRFFKIYMVAAIAPIPLAFFGGEPTQRIGMSYLHAFGGVCLEGAMIAVACVVYSVIAGVLPDFHLTGDTLIAKLLSYIVGVIFHTLLLAGTVKGTESLTQRYLGL